MTQPKPNLVESIATALVAGRWYLLILAAGLAVASWQLKQDVSFDNSIEGMFAADDPLLQDYQRLKEIFGGAEIVLAVYEDPRLFDPDGSGLQRLQERSQQLSSIRGVIGVLSLWEINAALNKVYGLGNLLTGQEQPAPVLNPEDPIAAEFLSTFEGYTHGHDRQTVAIVCLLERIETLQIPRERTIAALRSVTSDWRNTRITGEPVLLVDGFRFIERDGQRLNWFCLGLMALVILVCFRSIRWFVIPVAVIQLSMWMTLALLGVLGWQLTMVSSMLAAILAVISVATVVHIIVRYREQRLHKGQSRVRAVELVLASLFLPITWTCLTTAAGFLALSFSGVEPVADFGWMMVFGSLFVWLAVMLLVPGLALLGDFDADPQETWGEVWLDRALDLSSRFISSRPRLIGTMALLLFVVVGSGIWRLQVETDFTRNFRENSQIIQAYTFVEEKLGGAGVLDVVIRAPDKLDRDFLERIDRLQADLRNLRLESGGPGPALTHVVSFADADRIVRGNRLLGLLSPEIRFMAMSGVMPGFASQMRTTQPDADGDHWFRIMLRTSQRKTAAQQSELIDRVSATVDAWFPPSGARAGRPSMTTGFFVLLSNLVNSVLADQWRTFLIACLLISVVVWIAFRSIPLVAIALVPNILPIIALLGMLGWLGVRLNMGAAMIAAVSMGLSIDGTIHYLTSWRMNRLAGHSVASSVKRVQFRTGRAVIYATLALVLGFGSLCFSEFVPTVFFGALVGLSMAGGMVGNLIVLPVLLSLFQPLSVKRQRSAADRRESVPPASGGGPKKPWADRPGSVPETPPPRDCHD